MYYPPEAVTEEERGPVREFYRNSDTRIRWSTADSTGRPLQQGTIPANMLHVEHDTDSSEPWTIDVRLDHPVDVVLSDPDDRQRAYEVMQAIAEGKDVTIED